MKIVFLSNFLNHHQLPLCKAFLLMKNVEFKFVAVEAISRERLEFGYHDMDGKYDFVLRAYQEGEEKEKAVQEIKRADVLISGANHREFLCGKELKNKLIFLYQERMFRKERVDLEFILDILRAVKNHTLKANTHTYVLCAGAYVYTEFRKLRAYRGKMYKWGYFPEVIEREKEDALKLKPSGVIRILWVGRFLKLKRPQQALEVAKQLRQKGYCFELDMIGSGELKEEIKEQIRQEQLESCVHLLNAMPPDQVRNYMDRSNIFLFTSNKEEGWGAVLNEAMSSRCAVVANRWIGSVPFLVRHGENGLIYDGTTEDLVEKTETLAADREQQETLGEQAYHTMRTCWNAEVAAEHLTRLSQSLLAGEKRNRDMEGPCEYIG